jgi:hypothetical protein
MAYEVDSGTTDAASGDAPSRPAANSAGAAGPTAGRQSLGGLLRRLQRPGPTDRRRGPSGDPDQVLIVYTTEPGLADETSLRLLANWHQDERQSEQRTRSGG